MGDPAAGRGRDPATSSPLGQQLSHRRPGTPHGTARLPNVQSTPSAARVEAANIDSTDPVAMTERLITLFTQAIDKLGAKTSVSIAKRELELGLSLAKRTHTALSANVAARAATMEGAIAQLSAQVEQLTNNTVKAIEDLKTANVKTFASVAKQQTNIEAAGGLRAYQATLNGRNTEAEIIIKHDTAKLPTQPDQPDSPIYPLAGMSSEDIVTKIREAIETNVTAAGGPDIVVRAIQSLRSRDIRVIFRNANDAKAAANPKYKKWMTSLHPSFYLPTPSYQVVAFGVSTDLDTQMEHHRLDTAAANPVGTIDAITKMEWISKNERSSTGTLRITLNDPDMANLMIRAGFAFQGRLSRVERARRAPLFCAKCLTYGHSKTRCDSADACRKCRGQHRTEDHTDCMTHITAVGCEDLTSDCERPDPGCAICFASDHNAYSRLCPTVVAANKESQSRHLALGAYFPVSN